MPHISIQLFRSASPASLACANSTPLAHTLTATLEFGITLLPCVLLVNLLFLSPLCFRPPVLLVLSFFLLHFFSVLLPLVSFVVAAAFPAAVLGYPLSCPLLLFPVIALPSSLLLFFSLFFSLFSFSFSVWSPFFSRWLPPLELPVLLLMSSFFPFLSACVCGCLCVPVCASACVPVGGCVCVSVLCVRVRVPLWWCSRCLCSCPFLRPPPSWVAPLRVLLLSLLPLLLSLFSFFLSPSSLCLSSPRLCCRPWSCCPCSCSHRSSLLLALPFVVATFCFGLPLSFSLFLCSSCSCSCRSSCLFPFRLLLSAAAVGRFSTVAVAACCPVALPLSPFFCFSSLSCLPLFSPLLCVRVRVRVQVRVRVCAPACVPLCVCVV